MPEPQVTVRSTEAGRVTEVVVPDALHRVNVLRITDIVHGQVPRAEVYSGSDRVRIRQPNGPDVVALAGETLRIAAGRVERVQ